MFIFLTTNYSTLFMKCITAETHLQEFYLKKTKELILLTMAENNELNKKKISEELARLNEYIDNRLYYFK